ncbi:ATP synthase F1 subunit epsilon [Candidatus Odyssella thessalonicensis]|uniref:ATP synthase F1 subunit epsilon n=1 Tax=Candidatus Odyssella thessalonicensis TaxID=84647 RepID=UPI000225B6FE|nr:ATP synthase F1 subunit epsilon [Candidatus Odyssella thessalonicensis]
MARQLLDDQLSLSIITPEQTLYTGDVSMVVIPGAEGDFGVLPKHAPFISTLRAGEIKVYRNDTVSDVFRITGGFAEVVNDKCQIVADGLLS